MANSQPNIWQMQTERDVKGLTDALAHRDEEIRRRAAVALRIIDADEAVDDLRIRLELEASPEVRVALIAAIDHLAPRVTDTGTLVERSGPQSRVERLIDHLMSNRPEAAIQAAHALGDLGNKVAVPPLIVVFRNRRQPPSVRLAAAEALLKMDSAPAEVTLLAALRSDKWHLRRNGAAILGQLQAEWAVEPLAAALFDEKKQVAKTAHAALRRINTDEAQKKLAAAKEKLQATDTGKLRHDLGSQATIPTRTPALQQELAERLKRVTKKLEETGSRPTKPLSPKKPARPKPEPTDNAPTKPQPTPTDDAKPISTQREPVANTPAPPQKPVIPPPSAVTKPLTPPIENPQGRSEDSQSLAKPAGRVAPPDGSKPPTPKKPTPKKRKPSRRRKSATQRLTPPDDMDDSE